MKQMTQMWLMGLYQSLSTTAGSTRLARRAGSQHATPATASIVAMPAA
jgi:hypothetical protein